MKLGSVSSLIRVPSDIDPILGRIMRARELGLTVMSIGFRENRDHGYMASVAEAALQQGIELRLGSGGRFGSASAEERKVDIARTIENVLEVNRYAGIAFSSLANTPMSHNRWAADPPMDERIGIIAESLAAIGDGVAAAGITLGLENHCDYRGYEIAAMLRQADRPNVRAQLDTGNAFTVFEEPVECAGALAPWTVSVHLKDVKVTPLAPAPWRGSRAESAPLGGGQVDNVAICALLQEQAPDPANLALLIEPLSLGPDDDPDRFLRTSIDWARTHLARHIV
jgi:sugar phosphate isomerase/epimerase